VPHSFTDYGIHQIVHLKNVGYLSRQIFSE